MCFEVITEDLTSAAESMADCVSTVNSNTPTDVSDIATHMRGSSAAASAAALSTTWGDAYTAWAERATGYAEALRATASDMEKTEQVTTSSFSGSYQ